MESLGQGSDPSRSCNLSCSGGHARSLTHCAGPGIEPASQCPQEAADPIAPQCELHILLLFMPLASSGNFQGAGGRYMTSHVQVPFGQQNPSHTLEMTQNCLFLFSLCGLSPLSFGALKQNEIR